MDELIIGAPRRDDSVVDDGTKGKCNVVRAKRLAVMPEDVLAQVKNDFRFIKKRKLRDEAGLFSELRTDEFLHCASSVVPRACQGQFDSASAILPTSLQDRRW